MKNLVCLCVALFAACGGSKQDPASPTVAAGCPIVVKSEPAGADVMLDGKPAGQTPLETTAECHKIMIGLTKDGFQSAGITAELSAENATQPAVMSVTLAPAVQSASAAP